MADEEKRPENTEEPVAAKVAEIEKKAAEAEKKAADLYDQLLRLKAEFENYRKRVDRERGETIAWARADVLGRLLPLYDVLLTANAQIAKSEGTAKDVTAGLEMIFKEFTRVLESEGIVPVEALWKPYDHDLHEVLGSVETDKHPEGTVVEELQKGYLFKGKVLRPARVRVAKAKISEKAKEEAK